MRKSQNRFNAYNMTSILTRSVAYTASINPRIVHAIPNAGPFTTPMIGLGKSIRELTKLLKKKNNII